MMLTLHQRLALVVSLGLLAIIAAVLLATLWVCGGHLIYSLDDSYISLWLGWHIAHGQYGINVGEASAPASSILYPVVLAGFAWASWQDWAPLVINTVAALATGALFSTAVCRYGIVTEAGQIVRGGALVLAICVAINTVGLVFTGLEHSLHALTSVFVVLVLARTLETGEVPASLVAAIVLLPLWRFEGCALALFGITALALAGHRRAAAIALAGVAGTLGLYMLAMHQLGLPILPSSVLSKSPIAEGVLGRSSGPAGILGAIVRNVSAGFNLEAIPVFLLILIVLAHPAIRVLRPDKAGSSDWDLRQELMFAGAVAGSLLAHVLFGAWGWFCRYEAYAVAFGSAGALLLWRRPIGSVIARGGAVYFASLAAIPYVGIFYVAATILTPLAAQGHYQQQYQMHRFAADFYRRPVAVNDLGLVSYRNPNYVLDLWGLGSEPARQARSRADQDSAWVGALVESRHIGLAMIFDDWFRGQIPPSWRRLALLHSQYRPTMSHDTVAFYATSPEAMPAVLDALRAFRRHLVAGTSLVILK